MITELTDFHKSQIPVYVDRYVKIGRSTERIDREKIDGVIRDLYTEILGKGVPEEIKYFDSPHALWEFVKKSVGSDISFVCPHFCGSFDANIFAFYDFFFEVMNVVHPSKDIMRKYKIWKQTLDVGMIFPFDDVCLVSEKPTEIHIENNQLHCENGMAMKYADGTGAWMLHGVSVPKEYVLTSWNKLDCKLVLKEKNAERRRELVRKIGIERVIEKLGATVIDKMGDYELVRLSVDGIDRPYLKMINPSIGTYHIEGVPPSTKTVKEALRFRNGTDEVPAILT